MFDFACGSYSVAWCACICRLKMAGEDTDKSTWVERAKLAEQAERYDDMAKVGIDYNSHMYPFRHALCARLGTC